MDSSQVGVLEETHEVSLSGLLEGQHSRGLEAQVGLEVLGNLTNQALERELADEQLGALLILANLAQSDSAGPEEEGGSVREVEGRWEGPSNLVITQT